MHLFAKKESIKNHMKHDSKAGLSSIEGTDLIKYLNKMIEDQWIKSYQSPHHKNVVVYSLDEKGLQIAKTIQRLENENNPILKLPVFYDVKVLGSAYD